MSLEVVEKTPLIVQENQGDSLLELGVPVSRWMFSGLDLKTEIHLEMNVRSQEHDSNVERLSVPAV